MAYPMRRVNLGTDLAPLRVATRQSVVYRHAAFEQRELQVRRRTRGHEMNRIARRDQSLLDNDLKPAPSRRYDAAGHLRVEITSLRGIGSKRFNERGKSRLGRDFQLGREGQATSKLREQTKGSFSEEG